MIKDFNPREINLEITAGACEQFPVNKIPQIAFVGKSNVGKSSLINCLINRKSLAHTSNTPGKTRTINFYNIDNKLYFVDLPGYGYARAPKTEIQKWSKLTENYLANSKMLRLFLLLIDIRHKPNENDKNMYDWLKFYKKQMIIIATKADKIKLSLLEMHVKNIRENLKPNEIIIPFSSATKLNRDLILKNIYGVL